MSNGIPFWPVCDVTQKAQSSMSNFVPVYKVAIETFFEVYDLFKKVVYHRGVIIAAFTNCYHKSVFARRPLLKRRRYRCSEEPNTVVLLFDKTFKKRVTPQGDIAQVCACDFIFAASVGRQRLQQLVT
jgi:hypothetical protein